MHRKFSESEAISLASRVLDVDGKYLQPFEVPDPFNAGNVVRGMLCQKPDKRYGALAVLEVNDAVCPQRIFATPKLHYPFGKDGSFHFPIAKSAALFEKLDGTNVLSYSYKDADGNSFRSYKLRLSPFLRNGKWGDFLDMWKEMIGKHPDIAHGEGLEGCSVSYEMYGSHNEHLIKYDKSLEAAMLFGVSAADGSVVPPDMIRGDIPRPALLSRIQPGDDLVAKFAEIRKKMEEGNTKNPDGKITGTEGCVWQITSPGGEVSLWKCKPESVEEIHWATGINKQSVLATCWNLLESADVLSEESLLPLLREEYQDDDISRFSPHIKTCIDLVNTEQHFRSQALASYQEISDGGLSIEKNKGEVMRALSKKFPKEKMSKVYGAISGRGVR